MSELIQKNDNCATIRWKLLTSASALALTAYVSSTPLAHAEDGDRSQVWVELGGQLSRLQDGQEIYAPLFVSLTPPDFAQPQKAERPPLYGIDETGKISFRPDNSDWTFSASIRYGRAGSGKHVRHQTYPTYTTRFQKFFNSFPYYHRTKHGTAHIRVDPLAGRFTDAVTKQSENHAILDFQAGKDLGLGLFGRDAVSSLSAGVRFAQFRSKSRINLKENPDWQFLTHIATANFSSPYFVAHRTTQQVYQPYHSFAGSFSASRSFKGLGPSISWNSSLPFAGNTHDGALAFDWGLNAAILFGRQRTKIHHQTTGRYHSKHAASASLITTYQHPVTPDHTRSRNVTVPNVGGFAGISWNYDSAKVSFGYKADFFFNAIDGGIDTAKKEDRGFYGPYASISIGLGD